jgi:hypothetical protein
VEQLSQLTGKDLRKGRGLGRKSLDEVKEALCDLGFSLHETSPWPNLEKPSMNENKIGRLTICAAKRGYILTDGANPRVLESPHLIRVFESKDSLLAWLKENLVEEVTPPAPQQKED